MHMCEKCFHLGPRFALQSYYVTEREKCDCPCPDATDSGFCAFGKHRVLTETESEMLQ